MDIEKNETEYFRPARPRAVDKNTRTKVIVDSDETFGRLLENARGEDWAHDVDVISVRGVGTIRVSDDKIIVSDYVED